jgi:N-acetylglucosamine kinase-like BadF-type ATPase
VGVDGGGTSTVAWASASDEPERRGVGEAGPSHVKSVGQTAAVAAIRDAASRAVAALDLPPDTPLDAACLGIAGIDNDADRDLLRNDLEHLAGCLTILNDTELVLAAGTPEGWGIAVIGGTGANCYGRTPEGRMAMAGGWGHLIGDDWSAYGVALAALRALVRSHDGRSPLPPEDSSALLAAVRETLGASTVDELISTLYSPEMDRTRIASLSRPIVEAVEHAPAVAPRLFARLLDHAASEIALAVEAVARRLFPRLAIAEIPLALAGGFLLSSRHVQAGLASRLALSPHRPPAPVPEPAAGALRLAQRSLHTQDLHDP